MDLSFSGKSPTIAGRTLPIHIMLPFITIAVVLLATLFPVRSIYGQWRANQSAISQESGQLNQLQTKLDALNGYNDDQLTSALNESNQALPENKNVPGLIGGLERLAQENNLQISGLDLHPGSIASTSAIQAEMDVQLTVTGDIKNVDAFLTKLGQIRRIMVVTKIDGANGTLGGGLTTSITLAVYSLALPSATDLGNNFVDPLPPLTQTNFNAINKLAQMPVYTELSGFSIPLPVASSAASPSASASATP